VSFAVYNATLDRIESGPFSAMEPAAHAMRQKHFDNGCKYRYAVIDTETSELHQAHLIH
jgi:hypothetical protein